MKRFVICAALAASVPAYAPAQAAPTPPVAVQKPYVVKGPKSRNDPYYWLRDDTRKDPAMLEYLKAENAYTDAVLAGTKPLQEQLFNEIISRIKQDGSQWRADLGVDYRFSRRQSVDLLVKNVTNEPYIVTRTNPTRDIRITYNYEF